MNFKEETVHGINKEISKQYLFFIQFIVYLYIQHWYVYIYTYIYTYITYVYIKTTKVRPF